jgi:hypothetical protein
MVTEFEMTANGDLLKMDRWWHGGCMELAGVLGSWTWTAPFDSLIMWCLHHPYHRLMPK